MLQKIGITKYEYGTSITVMKAIYWSYDLLALNNELSLKHHVNHALLTPPVNPAWPDTCRNTYDTVGKNIPL